MSDMQCERCGRFGIRWMGDLLNPTGTECPHCGGRNCQLPEGSGYYDEDGCIECDWGERPCHCFQRDT